LLVLELTLTHALQVAGKDAPTIVERFELMVT
jgi:hypothetical protein